MKKKKKVPLPRRKTETADIFWSSMLKDQIETKASDVLAAFYSRINRAVIAITQNTLEGIRR